MAGRPLFRGRATSDSRRPEDDPPDTSRLFVAVPLSDDVRASVGGLMEQVAGRPVDVRGPGQLRWVRADGLHLTLRFLGATPNARVAEIGDALRAAASGVTPFRIVLAGGGAFPDRVRPRVLWLAIAAGADELAALVRRVDGELERLGWPAEERPFRPHLTLARADGVPGAAESVTRLVEAARDLRLETPGREIVLYKSLLGRGPARYEALATAELSG